MDKRYVLALVLMSIVMVIWLVVQSRVSPPPERNQQTSESSVQEPENGETGKEEVIVEENSTEFQLPVTEGPKAQVKTNYYEAEIALEHATISSWKLNKYERRDKANGDVVDLIPPLPSALYLAVELISGDIINWTSVDKTSITLAGSNQEQDSITFKGEIEGTPLAVTKNYTFYRDSYMVDVDIAFANSSSEREVAFNGYRLDWGPGISADKEKPDRNSGAIVYFSADRKAKRDLKDEVASGEKLVWAGISNKYFSAVIIPDPSLETQYDRRTGAKSEVPYVVKPADIVQLVVTSQFGLEAGESKVHNFRLYAGPKDTAELKKIQKPETDEPANLELLVDFGFFGLIGKVMLRLLNAIYSFIGNYGVSIIIVTTLLKVLLYPLTMKSHKSMGKMQQLKEPLAELKEKHRDNPQELNKKTMALYKKHGVNPLSGCIIWLPQIPIFWAFYSVLREAIEVRGTPFFLWISDLSLPDTLFTIPILLQNGIPIRVLPILMGVAMFLQQRMTGTTMADPKQSKIMNYMSIFFMFIFYGFPSGLVLYWLWNNILTIGQQYFLSKRMAAEPIIEEETNAKKKKKGGKRRK